MATPWGAATVGRQLAGRGIESLLCRRGGRHEVLAPRPGPRRDTIIAGIFTIDQFDRREQAPGYIRGYDAVTGQLKWRFNAIPQPGEFGHETWEDVSWEHTGASNVWTAASADEELGYAYLPTATPTHNWYGGHRPGDNLFAETLLCLECETGRRVWHYRLIHHGVWDYDTASTPILADITVDGRGLRSRSQSTA